MKEEAYRKFLSLIPEKASRFYVTLQLQYLHSASPGQLTSQVITLVESFTDNGVKKTPKTSFKPKTLSVHAFNSFY